MLPSWSSVLSSGSYIQPLTAHHPDIAHKNGRHPLKRLLKNNASFQPDNKISLLQFLPRTPACCPSELHYIHLLKVLTIRMDRHLRYCRFPDTVPDYDIRDPVVLRCLHTFYVPNDIPLTGTIRTTDTANPMHSFDINPESLQHTLLQPLPRHTRFPSGTDKPHIIMVLFAILLPAFLKKKNCFALTVRYR